MNHVETSVYCVLYLPSCHSFQGVTNRARPATAPNSGLPCMKKDGINTLRHENGYTWR